MRLPVIAMLLVLLPTAVAACGERRDVADLAGGVAPFDVLRGMNAVAMRSGGVRAFRAAAVPAPGVGLRETIGEYDVTYHLPDFDGADGSWPNEDDLVYIIDASHPWPSDSAARSAFVAAVQILHAEAGAASRCLARLSPVLLVAQWQRDGGWSVTASFAPAVQEGTTVRARARHSVAVWREPLAAIGPEWREIPCAGTLTP